MENFIDQDQQWLLNCLQSTLDTNHDVRSFAEASLHQASLQPGFGVALSKVTVNKELPLGLRQLAAVLLKQFIKQHWQEDEETFIQPIVSTEEKAAVRNLLLLALDDPHGKICTAVGMAIASIAHYDWPEDWPNLLPLLLKLISDQANMNGVHGALKCLALISDDLDDKLVPKLVPILFPCLYTIVSSPHIYDGPLRTKALSIVYSCTSVLGGMSGVYKSETRELMIPMIKLWMEQFSFILRSPVGSEDPDDWSIRIEVLKCLIQFVQNFPSLTEAELYVILAPLWQTFVSCLKVYESASVQAIEDSYSGRVDSDGSERSLESFVVQLFEFLLTIVGNPRLVKAIGKNYNELVYYTIPFLQMTEEQVHTWSLDANQYVADEDEVTCSARISGLLLLEEVANAYGAEGIDAIIEAVEKRFNESWQMKVAGSTDWWRLREAAMFGLTSLSEEQVLEPYKSRFRNILEKVLTEDMVTGVHEYPFVHARAFSAVAKFSLMIDQQLRDHFLCGAIKAITLDVPSPVKVGACRAVSHLLPESNQGILQSQITGLLTSLTNLLKQASDETLHLVLETLQAAVKAGHDASTSIEPIMSPVILNMWAEHVSDPFISIDILEVLEAIKCAPGCMWPLVSRILPYIGPVLEKPQQQPTGLVAGSLDLLTMLLKNAPVEIVKALYDVCFNPVVHIIIQSDDHSEVQNATECLAAFVLGGKQELLSWSGDPGLTMKSLLTSASWLLDPGLESSGSLFVGTYILQLILHLPSQMAEHIRDLVAALVRRMQSCQISGLKSSLILILARLVHLSAPNVEQFVDLLIATPAEGYENSLSYVMSEWTKHQGEIQGVYQIKVTTTALALLLSTRRAELANINVQGHLIKTTAGITTRSKAKSAPDQWTVMPLPSKILALLADMLIEIQEQGLDDDAEDDEDADWEIVQDGDVASHQDALFSMTTENARPTIEHLDAMAKALNESQDDDYEDDILRDDPLNEIHLARYVADFIRRFSHNDRPLFDHLCQSLTVTQRNAIQTVLNQ